MRAAPVVGWPDGKAFAFSVFDDTDRSSIANVRPVYDLLAGLGLRTTKSVWVLRGADCCGDDGATCEDPEYAVWAQGLAEQGFEIGLHNVASRTSPRDRTIEGMRRFRGLFGQDPSAHANHSRCRENLYWGEDRLTGVHRMAYRALHRFRSRDEFQGHVKTSPLFWGDVCRDRIKYVRNFVHGDPNTLAFCPQMPYHDPRRPYVNYWFASTEGPNVDRFVESLSEPNLDRLEAEGGACIMYTHFAVGFAPYGRLDTRFAATIQRLSERNGWFVPVSTLLDHLLAMRGHHELLDHERTRLERHWLAHKIRVGGRT